MGEVSSTIVTGEPDKSEERVSEEKAVAQAKLKLAKEQKELAQKQMAYINSVIRSTEQALKDLRDDWTKWYNIYSNADRMVVKLEGRVKRIPEGVSAKRFVARKPLTKDELKKQLLGMSKDELKELLGG